MNRLIWRGAEVLASVKNAEIAGINETMGECVTSAQSLVHTRTTALQGSLRLEGAHEIGNKITGRWGSFDINYALWQEVAVSHGSKPYLRPSMDANYPNLTGKINGHLA